MQGELRLTNDLVCAGYLTGVVTEDGLRNNGLNDVGNTAGKSRDVRNLTTKAAMKRRVFCMLRKAKREARRSFEFPK